MTKLENFKSQIWLFWLDKLKTGAESADKCERIIKIGSNGAVLSPKRSKTGKTALFGPISNPNVRFLGLVFTFSETVGCAQRLDWWKSAMNTLLASSRTCVPRNRKIPQKRVRFGHFTGSFRTEIRNSRRPFWKFQLCGDLNLDWVDWKMMSTIH